MTDLDAQPTLGLVIPVWNDAPGVEHLVRAARRRALFDQIVVVDDASVPPVEVPQGIDVIRQQVQRGAGAGRNAGLAQITTSHVLFFDADDSMTDEMTSLWRSLCGRDFDFCLFRHHDSRSARAGRYGQMPMDEALWDEAGVAARSLSAPAPSVWPLLAQTANYPWNKIYRTDFLRAHDLHCSETVVHNDIRLHWTSFLAARRVLCSDRVAARHRVAAGAGRLTNRAGLERLAVFEVLEDVARHLEPEAAQADFAPSFWRFASYLFDWVHATLSHDHRAAARAAMAQLVRRHLSPDFFDRLVRQDPVVARRLMAQAAA